MKSFHFSALMLVASAIKIQEPWKESTLPTCPEFTRTVLDDGQTHVVRYPHVGATCSGPAWPEAKGTKEAQAATLLQLEEEPAAPVEPTAPPAGAAPPAEKKKAAAPWTGLQHCPNMPERMTLTDGQTKAIAWPAAGANCHNEGPVTAQQ